MSIEDLKKIRDAININKLVVFVGAGVSMNSDLPSWSNLIKSFAISVGIDSNKDFNSEDYLKIAQYYYNQRGMKEYYDDINKIFDINMSPNLIHKYILKMLPRHIVTTNYDDLLEQAIESNILFYDTVRQDSDLPYTQNGRLLIKMHGDLKLRNIVLKEDDYLKYSNNFRLIETFVKSLFANYTILFIGYSLQDYDLKLIINDVKEILGENFQKAYFIDSSENKKLNVEIDYFKNLGVNIISKDDIPNNYKNIEVNELEDTQGKNIVRIIKSIIEYENNSNNIIEYYYEKLKIFKDLMTIRFDDIVDILGIGGHYNKTNSSIELSNINNNDKIYRLVKKLEYILTNYKDLDSSTIKKFNYINVIFARAGIRTISIIRYNGKEKSEEIIYEITKEAIESKLQLIEYLQNNKFLEIELLAKQSFRQINMHKNKYFNELIRAYSNYLVNRFVSAYKILKSVSKQSYKDREYIAFYISEYDKRYLIKKIKNISISSKFGNFMPTDIGENVYFDELEQLIKEYDDSNFSLKDVHFLVPKKIRDIKFLNDLVFDNGFIYSRLVEIAELKKNVENEVKARFLQRDPLTMSKGILQIKNEVHTFWNFTNQNFIMIDDYKEIKDYYCNYIYSLFSTYSSRKGEEDNNDILADFGQVIPNYKFELLDIYIINRYINNLELRKLIYKYDINEIEVNIPSCNIKDIFLNLNFSYVSVEYRSTIEEMIKNMLVFTSKVKFDNRDLNIILDSIIKMISSNYIDYEIYENILYFLDGQNKYNKIKSEYLYKFINAFINKLTNVKFNNKHGGHEIQALMQCDFITNILQLINTENKGSISYFELNSLIVYIQYGELSKYKRIIIKNILIPLYKFVITDFEKKISDMISDELNLHPDIDIYARACEEKIIKADKVIEEKFWNSVEHEFNLYKDRTSKGKKIDPDPFENILVKIANMFYFNNILCKDKLKKYVGYFDIYDLIVDKEDFDYTKFQLKWIYYFNFNYIKEILHINRARSIIKEKLEQEIIKNDKVDKVVKKIYFELFK